MQELLSPGLPQEIVSHKTPAKYQEYSISVSITDSFQKGRYHLKNGNTHLSTPYFKLYKSQNPSQEASYYLAQSYENANELASALEEYLEALLYPTCQKDIQFNIFKNLGNLYLREGKVNHAEDFYQKAYGLNPESPQLLVNLGTLEIQKERYDRALDFYRRAIQLDLRFASAWVGMAISYNQFGDKDLAWASLQKAIDIDSFNPTTLMIAAQWSKLNKDIDYILKLFMNFFDTGRFDSNLSLLFIELCIQSSKMNWARLEIERALLWEPKHPELLKFDRALAQHGF